MIRTKLSPEVKQRRKADRHAAALVRQAARKAEKHRAAQERRKARQAASEASYKAWQDRIKAERARFLSSLQLKDLGWTHGNIVKVLGRPDKIEEFKVGRREIVRHLWRKSRCTE